MLQGPVLKVNANQRYATTAITAAVLRELADMAKVPLQVNTDPPLAHPHPHPPHSTLSLSARPRMW